MCLSENVVSQKPGANRLCLTTSKTVLPFTKSPPKHRSMIQDELDASHSPQNKDNGHYIRVYI